MLWHAVAAKNLQMLKGDCNGHRPNEIIWPCTTAKEGVIKRKSVCTAMSPHSAFAQAGQKEVPAKSNQPTHLSENCWKSANDDVQGDRFGKERRYFNSLRVVFL